MNFGNKIQEERVGMQMAPMIDVIFLLLIFFVMTSVYTELEAELGIQIPTADQGEHTQRTAGEIIINVKQDGAIIVNQVEMNVEQLTGILRRVVAELPGQGVIIRGDAASLHQHNMNVLNACKSAGIWNVAFAVSENDAEQ